MLVRDASDLFVVVRPSLPMLPLPLSLFCRYMREVLRDPREPMETADETDRSEDMLG